MTLAKLKGVDRQSPAILLLSTCWKNGLYSVQFKENENDECIICISHKKTVKKYFYIKYKGKQVLLHRIIYSFYNKDLTDELLVRHLCNNSTCCNPKHLAVGTHKDNGQDWAQAGSPRWLLTAP